MELVWTPSQKTRPKMMSRPRALLQFESSARRFARRSVRPTQVEKLDRPQKCATGQRRGLFSVKLRIRSPPGSHATKITFGGGGGLDCILAAFHVWSIFATSRPVESDQTCTTPFSPAVAMKK